MKSASKQLLQLAIASALALTLAACGNDQADEQAAAPVETPAVPAPVVPEAVPAAAPAESNLEAVIAGEHRSAENRARDQWRHPAETLAFFGLQPTHTVVEITPGGGGWYAEILAPALREQGRYVAVVMDPTKVANERAAGYYTEQNQKLRDKFAGNAELYGQATVVEVDPAAPVLGEPGSADLVLTFRNVHNWIQGNNAEAMFKGFFDVLKPGGTLGVVEHRAAEGATAAADSGYMTEQSVIDLATAAGFELAEKSEINANPADTRDHPNGVWTLPPSRQTPEGEDAAKYDAIGESDRMTLKFVKPAAADAGAAPADGGAEAAPAEPAAEGEGG